jgi:hypothetical protein
MAASLFGAGTTPQVNVNGTLVPQQFTATAGQTVFTLTSFTYTPGTNSLLVFINGQRQILTRDFLETSSTSFTLVEAVTAGDYVDVIGFPQITLTAVPQGSIDWSGLPTTNPGAGTKKLWADPADSYRVKFAV